MHLEQLEIPAMPQGEGHQFEAQVIATLSGVPFLLFHLLFFFSFWLCHVACEILVPQPGIEPEPPALEVQNLNHWTAR